MEALHYGGVFQRKDEYASVLLYKEVSDVEAPHFQPTYRYLIYGQSTKQARSEHKMKRGEGGERRLDVW